MALPGGANRIDRWPMPNGLVIPSTTRDLTRHAVYLPGGAHHWWAHGAWCIRSSRRGLETSVAYPNLEITLIGACFAHLTGCCQT